MSLPRKVVELIAASYALCGAADLPLSSVEIKKVRTFVSAPLACMVTFAFTFYVSRQGGLFHERER